jgi:hypothetical protein
MPSRTKVFEKPGWSKVVMVEPTGMKPVNLIEAGGKRQNWDHRASRKTPSLFLLPIPQLQVGHAKVESFRRIVDWSLVGSPRSLRAGAGSLSPLLIPRHIGVQSSRMAS